MKLGLWLLVALIGLNAVDYILGAKLLASNTRQLAFREHRKLKRLVKRQLPEGCNPKDCAVPNCGRDFIAKLLPGQCCEKCIPLEYAQNYDSGRYAPQTQQPQYPPEQRNYDPYANRGPQSQQGYPSQQPNPYPNYYPPAPQQRIDVYIFGPDRGAQVAPGQSIYFDCEAVAPYQQNVQPRWSRQGGQPLPAKARSHQLEGSRRINRLTINDASNEDAGRYECNAGTGNPQDQASIDLQVTQSAYQPQDPRPQQPQQPQYPNYPNQGYYPPQPQPQDPYYNYGQYPNYPPQYPQQPYPGYENYPSQPQPDQTTTQQPGGAGDDEGNDGEDLDEGADDDEDQNDQGGAGGEATQSSTETTTTTEAQDTQPAEDDGGESYDQDYGDSEAKK